MSIKVQKRDGRLKKFNGELILNALKGAYCNIYGSNSRDWLNCATITADIIVLEIESLNKKVISVEDIQDICIEQLSKYDKPVAKAFADYREERRIIRDQRTQLMKNIQSILDQSNDDILKENANKEGTLFSTQRDLIAGQVSKAIAQGMIPRHLMKLMIEGKIKIHDLDYYMQGIYNCELVNLEDMLQNGTVISKKKINKPHSLKTAMTLASQIAAQVASCTYGGQTMSLSHLAPFVRISEEKITRKYKAMNLPVSDERLAELIHAELLTEIVDSVQTFNYQISTIMSTQGQTPFITIAMYISENPEYEKETVMLITEFLNQRLQGMENEFGIVTPQTFPKLLYFTDENNITEDSEYYWLTEQAAECTANTMSPEFISVKKMKEQYGVVFPPMGCRAMIGDFVDKNGEHILYGRGNLGAQTINLPYIALEAEGDINKFWKGMKDITESIRELGELRYEKLRGIKAKSAPILWQYGAIARLDPEEYILKGVNERGFTVSMGYSGIYECVKVLTGKSHTTPEGFALAEKIMKYMKDRCDEFKANQPHLRFALYGTPQESTTGWFSDKLRARFGVIEDVTDKGWVTNSYHVDIKEEIDAFAKLDLEGKLQAYSNGGAISYVETYNLSKNVPAVLNLMKFMYNHVLYAEMNFELDSCGECGFKGVMDYDPVTLDWICPNCGNRNQDTLSCIRRTCGYLGETKFTRARKLDILNRVKHL